MSILGWNFFLEIVSQKGKWVGGGLEKLHYLTSSFVPPILFFSPWDLVLEITLSNTAKLSRNVYILLLLSFRNSTMHLGQLFFLIGWNFKCLLLFYFFYFLSFVSNLYMNNHWNWSFKIFHFILWTWNPRWPYPQTFWSFKHWH